jgi:hypothetical protein
MIVSCQSVAVRGRSSSSVRSNALRIVVFM